MDACFVCNNFIRSSLVVSRDTLVSVNCSVPIKQDKISVADIVLTTTKFFEMSQFFQLNVCVVLHTILLKRQKVYTAEFLRNYV